MRTLSVLILYTLITLGCSSTSPYTLADTEYNPAVKSAYDIPATDGSRCYPIREGHEKRVEDRGGWTCFPPETFFTVGTSNVSHLDIVGGANLLHNQRTY